MTLLRTADHECRECPLTDSSPKSLGNYRACHHPGMAWQEIVGTGIHPDCPLPVGVEMGALKRSAETSQAIEEGSEMGDSGPIERPFRGLIDTLKEENAKLKERVRELEDADNRGVELMIENEALKKAGDAMAEYLRPVKSHDMNGIVLCGCPDCDLPRAWDKAKKGGG